jgi:hypothetical protein
MLRKRCVGGGLATVHRRVNSQTCRVCALRASFEHAIELPIRLALDQWLLRSVPKTKSCFPYGSLCETSELRRSSIAYYFSNLMLRISLRLIASSPGSFSTPMPIFRNILPKYGMAPRIGTLFSTRTVRVASTRTTFESSKRKIFPASVSVEAGVELFRTISQT